MITSYANKAVKEVIQLTQKSKARKQLELFVAEGIKMFREAPAELLCRVYVAQSAEKELLEKCGSRLKSIGYELVADEIFRKMSDTKTPQGILSVLRWPHYNIEEMLQTKGGREPLLLLLEDIQDPGNLGTMFRTAEAAGADGILMSKETADIYNPKTIRSTMGSVYRVPFLYTADLKAAIAELQERGIAVYAAHLEGERFYDAFDYRRGTAFLVGNEGNGLRRETAHLADAFLRIPMEGSVESLNAAVAASVLLYEAHRQRRNSR